MEYAWNMYGICMEYVWNMYDMYGICVKLSWGRATVSQTVHVDVAPLRPFESLLFCRATVPWNMRVDFAPLRPFETLFLCPATVSWNMRVDFAPLWRFAATCRTQNQIPKPALPGPRYHAQAKTYPKGITHHPHVLARAAF